MLNVINIDTGLFSGVLYNELTNGIISHCENAREVLCKQEMTKEADTEATIDEIKSALYDIVDRRAFEELRRLLDEKDLEDIARSSMEFRRGFKLK